MTTEALNTHSEEVDFTVIIEAENDKETASFVILNRESNDLKTSGTYGLLQKTPHGSLGITIRQVEPPSNEAKITSSPK